MLKTSRTSAIGLATLALAACSQGTGGEQTLVDRAALTVQEMMTQNVSQDPKSLLRRAKGAMICPRVFKAGFFIGGEGGSCVLLGRSGNGTWSYPTFYDIGSGSFGFQFGVQDSQLLMLIMTSRGLNAVMDSQVRLGANVSVAVATVGMGVQGSTTTAVGADIIAFASARGLFGGVSLEGGVMSARIDGNQAYYGQPFAARQIVLQMQGVNPGADPLREVLTRYGNADRPAPAGPYAPPPYAAPPSSSVPPYSPPPYSPSPSYAPGPASSPPTDGPDAGLAPQPGPPPASSAYPPSYQPPGAQEYRPAQAPPVRAPAVAGSVPLQAAPRTPPPASYSAPPPPAGYQPPPGQYTYPPVREQALPPPAR